MNKVEGEKNAFGCCKEWSTPGTPLILGTGEEFRSPGSQVVSWRFILESKQKKRLRRGLEPGFWKRQQRFNAFSLRGQKLMSTLKTN